LIEAQENHDAWTEIETSSKEVVLSGTQATSFRSWLASRAGRLDVIRTRLQKAIQFANLSVIMKAIWACGEMHDECCRHKFCFSKLNRIVRRTGGTRSLTAKGKY